MGCADRGSSRFACQPGVIAVAPHRLVGDGGEDEQRGADHEGEHPDIKEHGAGDVHLADHGPMQVGCMAGQEGVAPGQGAQAGGQRKKQPHGDPAAWVERQVRLDPVGAGDDVLQQQCHRHDQSGHKTATGFVVAAQEHVGRHHGRKRQQQSHQHGGHHQVADRRVRCIAGVDQVGVQVCRQVALLLRQVHRLARRAEAPQQCIHRETHDAQHHEFTEGVKAAEVHQHHVDHVGATAFAQCAFQEKGRGALREGPAHHGQRQACHAGTGHDG